MQRPIAPVEMTGHQLEIVPLSREHWVVRYAGDVTPLSEHRTLAEARAP